jgi:ABC-2 type transport system permease protein
MTMKRRHWFLQLMATNLAASFALRAAFWLQCGMMALNNLLFFCFWWVLFTRFEEIRGWAIGDVAALFGVAAAGYGVVAVLFGGLHELARQIDDGELDPLLTQPKSVMLQAAAARTRPDGWGDIASGLVLVALSGYAHGPTLLIVPLAIAISATVLAATSIAMHSSAFWFGRTFPTVRMLLEMQLTFSVYPPHLFGGAMRVMLFTVLPAAFISHLPVELVRDFSWPTLAAALGGAAVFATLAVVLFDRGLRRYEGGNRFGVRG